MPDLDEDKKSFQVIPIKAVIGPVNKANNLLNTASELLSKNVKKAFPEGTIIQRGQQTYEVIGHGFHWSNPGRITLKNTNSMATIRVNVTMESEQEKIRILEHPEHE